MQEVMQDETRPNFTSSRWKLLLGNFVKKHSLDKLLLPCRKIFISENLFVGELLCWKNSVSGNFCEVKILWLKTFFFFFLKKKDLPVGGLLS